jgi:molecular chaperone GrpE
MEKEENLNQNDNTKQSTEDNSNPEKLSKVDQTNINKEETRAKISPEEAETTPEEAETTPEEAETTPEEKIKELEDKLARTFAEMENQRRRFEKEKDDAFDYGGFIFAKEALNLIDNLERSKLILESDEVLKGTEALKKTLEHLEIINKDLISIFTKNNIKPINCLNKKLDPNLHQAMMEIEDDEKEPGTIVQEVQKGFMIKERLLRPSLVGVSKKKSQKDEENKENKENKENLDK